MARQISICSHVDEEGWDRLRVMSSSVTFAKNAFILEQDEPVERVFIITDGMVKLYRLLADGQRQITGFMGPGDLLGGIKGQGPSGCTAEALTRVEACAFRRPDFLRLVHDYPDLCFSLLIMATDEIEAQHDHLTLLGRKRVEERLATFLLIASERWQADDGNGSVVSLPMRRGDIADHLGQTVESLSRAFRKLRTLGFIDLPKPNRVILKNLPALYHLAGIEEIPHRQVSLGL